MNTLSTVPDEFRAAADTVAAYTESASDGPWLAMFTDSADGEPITHREPGWDDGEKPDKIGELSLRCGTALPDEHGTLPGIHCSHHILAQADEDLSREQAGELFASLRWAALLHPGCGPLLAELFNKAANDYDQIVENLHPALVPDVVAVRWWQPLLGIARQVNAQHDADAMCGDRHDD